MIRIFIDWDMVSPALPMASGIVSLHYSTTPAIFKEIIKFRVTKDKNSLGYKSLDEKGIPNEIYEAVKPQLDVMVKAFYDGMRLTKNSCSWVIHEDMIKSIINFNSAHKHMHKYTGERDGD